MPSMETRVVDEVPYRVGGGFVPIRLFLQSYLLNMTCLGDEKSHCIIKVLQTQYYDKWGIFVIITRHCMNARYRHLATCITMNIISSVFTNMQISHEVYVDLKEESIVR